MVCSFSDVSDREQLHSMLTNLHKCLLEYFTEKDRETFLCKTLPMITQLAADLPKLAAPNGIPFLRQETGVYISVTYLIYNYLFFSKISVLK